MWITPGCYARYSSSESQPRSVPCTKETDNPQNHSSQPRVFTSDEIQTKYFHDPYNLDQLASQRLEPEPGGILVSSCFYQRRSFPITVSTLSQYRTFPDDRSVRAHRSATVRLCSALCTLWAFYMFALRCITPRLVARSWEDCCGLLSDG